MKKTILIVEDEIKILRFLELELKYEGYQVLKAQDGKEALDNFSKNQVDLILLDIMLPKLSGIQVCRRIRQTSQVPIIMLTAKDDTLDKVMGLDTGADDYMTKPFEIEELLARIRVALRRNSFTEKTTHIIRIGDLSLDSDKHMVCVNNNPIDLTKREFDFLKYLMENKNIVLSRDNIIKVVWGYDYVGDTNIVDVYIRYLRSKIDDKYNKKFIHTIRGVGYTIKDENF
ncbi:response regulator transcription factor [Anaeromicrobium sediminis]|uniref:Stage 0 sporulation protein A homolog n=1 Tax=Anaeromicrobium sediminis TaxID=1478221 RepID=A0A267MJC1_9FIRM|nr:response regulator transcription factor [Anaeromicrobium sediminis]PAB59669.1 DNA-binding response regulator [Anaeromicrobium sediminis]